MTDAAAWGAPARHPSVARVLQAATERGLRIEIRQFPEGTRTAEDAARAVGCSVGQIVKSLVFVADALGDELPDLARRIAEADESRALGRIAPHDRVAGIRERPAVEVIRGAADHRHRPAGDNGDVRGELGRLRPAHHREPWWELG